MMEYDVVTVGSATVDLFADTDSELIKIDTRTTHEELIAYPLGSKILIHDLNMTTGGGGTNTAVAFATLGLKTAFLGKIGEDENGEFIVHQLEKSGVDFIGGHGGFSGVSIILNSIEDDRTILAFKGANNELHLDEIPEFEAKWLYVASMLGESFDSVEELVHRTQAKVAYNPSSYQAKLGYEALKPMIDYVYLLIVNREEACQILGLRHQERIDIEQLLTQLRALGPELVVITDGPNGAHLYDGKTHYYGRPHDGLSIAETTGAGDAFSSSFVGGLILEYDLEKALDIGMTNAESVIRYRGAKNKLLSLDEVMTAIAEQPRPLTQTPLMSANAGSN